MSVILSDTISQVDGASRYDIKMEVTDQRGHLACNCKMFEGTRWCEHLQRAVTENLDRNSLLYGNPDEQVPCVVYVPIVPTIGFWLAVTLTDLHRSGMAVASVQLDSSAENVLRSVELGVVLAGQEGRQALRRMAVAWLEDASRDLYCPAFTHKNVRWSRASRGIRSNTPRDLLQAFSIINSGVCSDCANYTNFDDDIPEI